MIFFSRHARPSRASTISSYPKSWIPGLRPGMTALLLMLLFAAPASAADVSRMAPFLDVQGIVEGDVTLAGARITVEAEIAGDMVLAGGSVGIGAATKVQRNAFVFADAIAMGGEYAQRVWAVGDEVVLDVRTSGDVSVAASRVVVGPNARIGGKLNVWSAEPAQIDPRAVVAGGVIQNFGGAGNAIEALMGYIGTVLRWVYNATMIVAALAVAIFAPGFLFGCAGELAGRPVVCGLWGFGLAVGVPLLALFAAITLVGLPFAGTLLLMMALALAIGYIVAAGFVGLLALRLAGRAVQPAALWRIGAILFGLVVLAGVRHIPEAGSPLIAAAFVFGLGALARETHRRLK